MHQPDPAARPSAPVGMSGPKPGCRHCAGRGIVAYRTIREDRVPILCRCMARRGAPAMEDQVMAPIVAAILDGTYGQKLSADVRRLPGAQYAAARAKIAAHHANETLPPNLRAALADALAALPEEAPDGHAAH